MTPSGIKPATFRFVAQHLNHCATAVPVFYKRKGNYPSNFYVLLTVHRDHCVKKNNLMHNLFFVYFFNLYMFRAYLDPSSGGTTVCIQHLVLIILFI